MKRKVSKILALSLALLFLLDAFGEEKKKGEAKKKEGKEGSEMVAMKVKDMVVFPDGNNAVLLVEKEGERMVPVWIGVIEAYGILLRLNRQKPPRPLTLDLMEEILRTFNGKVERLEIDDLQQGVFLGKLYIKKDGKEYIFDARPSDSIGLCLGAMAPIFVSKAVIEKSGITEKELLEKLMLIEPKEEEKEPPKGEAL
ncbi:MAG: hypothetical protein Kow0090_09260 [Myxococcota bacterium]